MTETLHKTTQELIKTIERKDKRFRFAQTIFMIMSTAALIIGGMYFINGQNRDRIDREKQTSNIIQKQSDKIDDLSKKIQCLSNFFSQPDRQNLVITDPNKCFTDRLDNDGGFTNSITNPGPDNTIQNNNTNPTNSQVSNTQTPASDQNQPPDGGSGQEANPPRKILGIPVCIPFTNVCARK